MELKPFSEELHKNSKKIPHQIHSLTPVEIYYLGNSQNISKPHTEFQNSAKFSQKKLVINRIKVLEVSKKTPAVFIQTLGIYVIYIFPNIGSFHSIYFAFFWVFP
jgi:hypothetical protein